MTSTSPRIELRDLRLVREIAGGASVTRAATRLHLSQSALSHRLAKLERNFGALLFERVGKRMVPTVLGLRLVEVAEEILRRVEEVEAELHLEPGSPRTALRVAASCATHYHWLAQVLADFSSREPSLDVRLSLQATQQQMEDLRNDSVDLVITAHPPKDAGLVAVELFSIEVIALAAASHPLTVAATRCGGVDWTALRAETLLIQNLPRADEVSLRTAVEACSQSARRSARQTVIRKVHLPEAIPALARAGRGVGVLCRWQQSPRFDLTGLSVLSLFPRCYRRFWGVWRKDNARRLPFDAVTRTLRTYSR